MRIYKLVLLSASLFIGSLSAKPQPLDGVAAIVNDAIITKSELHQQMKLISKQIEQTGTALPDKKTLERQVLDHLILNEIQLQMAKRSGIHVSEIMLDNAIENIAKQNHMTITQLRHALTEEGMDFNQYRENIRHQMEISQLQQRELLSSIHVSEQEISQFLHSPNGLGAMHNEYRLGHILISLPDAPSPEQVEKAAKKAQEIIAKLRAGEDFTQLAFAESTGEQALHGGDLGWRKLPELPTIFEKIVSNLKVNEIPDPIRTGNGFHIIKLLEKRNTAELPAVQKTLVRHILIKTNAVTSDQDAQKRLKQLKEKILKGEDFAQLAKTHSADLASASNGGSIGWVTSEVLVPEFSQKMESLPLNEISEPFKSSFGWHIVQVLDRKAQSNDETMLRQKAKEMIQQRKFEEKLHAWSRQIQDEAYIKRYYES